MEKARRLMADNHYGWFERIGTGVYGLSPNGRRALGDYRTELERLRVHAPAAVTPTSEITGAPVSSTS